MKNLIIFSYVFLLSISLNAQEKYFTKNGTIVFDATTSTSPEKVSAINKSVACVLDTKTGNIQFSVLMQGFEFEQALMREHFHENYMESEKFPKSVFKGQITNVSSINFTKNGTYDVSVRGQMQMHGITKPLDAKGKLMVNNGKISVFSNFSVVLADYQITVPRLVGDKVAKTASIKVDCVMQVLNN